MKSGALSGEQVDAVAQADTKTDGAASADESLLDELSQASADETKGIVDKFIVDKADADTAEKEYRRQRALRDVRKHRTATGLAALTISGDDASIDAMHKQLMADAGSLYRRDGGSDVPNTQHPRTHGHRLFDSVKARVTGSGDVLGVPAAQADVAATNPEATGCADSVAGGRPGGIGVPASSRYTPPAARRPTIVVTVPVDKLTGANPSLVAEQLGVGPISDEVLAAYLGDSRIGCDLVGVVFGRQGQPLWLGRTARDASLAQFLALMLRDRGCVDCGADPARCHVHHRIPWNAPAKGETNIDDLALMCSDCHHRLHEQKLTLYRDRTTGRWRKRPATPDEISPLRSVGKPSDARRTTGSGVRSSCRPANAAAPVG